MLKDSEWKFYLESQKQFFNGKFSEAKEYFYYVKRTSFSLHDSDGLNELLEVLKKYSKKGTDRIIDKKVKNSIFHKGNLVINSDLIIEDLIVTGNLTINGKVKVNGALVVGDSLHFTQDLIANTRLIVVGNKLTSSDNANFECDDTVGYLIVGGNIKIDGSLIYDYYCFMFGENIQIKGDLIADGLFNADKSNLEIVGNFVSLESFKAKKLQVEKSIISSKPLEIEDEILSKESVYVDIVKTRGKIKYKKDIRIRAKDYSRFEGIEKI